MEKIKKYFHQINKNSLSYIILFGLGKLHLTYKIATLLHLEKFLGRKNDLPNMTEARMYLQQVSEKPHGHAISLKAISLEYEYDLSVIIPAYNVQEYLTDCLNSVVDQTSRYKFEILVIDDGSTDKTPAIAKKFQKMDSRVKVISQKNGGMSSARNTGIYASKGRYITFLDSDDFLVEGCIDELLDIALKNKYKIVQGSYSTFSVVGEYSYHDMKGLSGYPWGKIFERSLFERVIFPEGYWFEDTLLGFLVYNQVNLEDVFVVHKDVYRYRINPTGITGKANYSPKVLDTFWVTELLLADAAKIYNVRNEYYLELFITQCRINVTRTRNMSNHEKKSIFLLTSYLVDKYFSGIVCHKKELNNILEAIRKKQYGKFYLACILK